MQTAITVRRDKTTMIAFRAHPGVIWANCVDLQSSLKWRSNPSDNAGNQPAERTSMKEKTENATKFLQAVARMRESGIVVADKTRKGGGMGLVGGVSRTARNNEMLHSDILPEHSCDGELIQLDRSHAYLKQARCSTCGTEFTYAPDSD
jgi:hypothetical protein